MTEIRDGLTTAMRYAVYALGREFGPSPGTVTSLMPDPGADTNFYTVLRKPPYEAYKAYEVMRREWQLDVVPVCPDRSTVAGDSCYHSLAAVPGGAVDCVVSFMPSHSSQALAEEMTHAGVRVLWRMFGPIINGFDDTERAIYANAGITVVNGCVLAHWDVIAAGVPLHQRMHHACHIHGLGKKKLRGAQTANVGHRVANTETPTPASRLMDTEAPLILREVVVSVGQ